MNSEQNPLSTSIGITSNDEQRYRRWWESKDEKSEAGSFFEMMYEDAELVVECKDALVDEEQGHWVPEYQIDERYTTQCSPA